MKSNNMCNGELSSDFTLNINDYTLEKYVGAKVPESTLELIFNPEAASVNQPETKQQHGQQKCSNLSFPFSRTALFEATIKTADVLVEANNDKRIKRIVDLTLDISKHPFEYLPGDTIAILPSNDVTTVLKLLQRLELLERAEDSCQLKIVSACTKKTAKVPAHIPLITTPEEILRDCLNLYAVPKKQFLAALAACTEDAAERAFLQCLSSKEGATYYNELFLEKGITLIDLLLTCSTCKPTLALLVEHLPRLLPRPYSIANSPLSNQNEINIIYSTLNDKPGVTTAMLNNYVEQLHEQKIQPPPTVLIYARETNQFRYIHDDAHTNQIFIAVGTAVAPFIGFLQHKALSEHKTKSWLYAGSKSKAALPKYNFFLDFKERGILDKYLVCESTELTENFNYVQQLILFDAEEFVQFLMQDETTLYVCADGAKISKSIELGIAQCLQKVLKLEESEAIEILKNMRANKKYCEDLWL